MVQATAQTQPISKQEHKRAHMLHIAAQHFGAKGYKDTNMDQLAQAAGVSKGLLFVYFKNKRELFEAVLNEQLANWDRQTARALATGGVLSAWDELRQLFCSSFDYIAANPLLPKLFEADPAVMLDGVDSKMDQYILRFRRQLFEVLCKGVAAGEFRANLDLQRTAVFIHHVQQAHIQTLFNTGSYDRRDVEVSLDLIRHAIVGVDSITD